MSSTEISLERVVRKRLKSNFIVFFLKLLQEIVEALSIRAKDFAPLNPIYPALKAPSVHLGVGRGMASTRSTYLVLWQHHIVY